MWAAGCILAEMLTGHMLFAGTVCFDHIKSSKIEFIVKHRAQRRDRLVSSERGFNQIAQEGLYTLSVLDFFA